MKGHYLLKSFDPSEKEGERFENDKRDERREKPPARLTEKKIPSSYMSREKDRSQRKKKTYDQRYHLLFFRNRSRI